MTLAQLRDKADAKLATFWATLVTKEEAYHTKHGKYFQLMLSPQTKIVDGVDSPFVVRVAENAFTLDIDTAWSDTIPFNIEVQEYASVKSKGFVAQVWVTLPNNVTYTRWRKHEDTGAEEDSGWSVYDPSLLGLAWWM